MTFNVGDRVNQFQGFRGSHGLEGTIIAVDTRTDMVKVRFDVDHTISIVENQGGRWRMTSQLELLEEPVDEIASYFS